MKHAVTSAVVSAVTGFSLAAAVLAVNLEPDYWVPTVNRVAQASVTVVDDEDLASRESETAADSSAYQLFAYAAPKGIKAAAVAVPVAPAIRMPQIPSELGIPGIVLDAYQHAQEALAESDPTCHLDWQILAGVGKIESGHARAGQVDATGTTFTPILGPALTGGPYASIPDTDDGALDGDPVWDRAVGPMQFIPGTWRFIGTDGNDDGAANPHNVYDAALSAGRYLCAGSRDLSNRPSLDAALHTYNNSDSYVALVLAWIDGYRAGHVTPLPPRDPPPPTATATPTPTTTTPSPTPTGTDPTDPTPTDPTPTDPDPTGPVIGPAPPSPSPTDTTTAPEPTDPEATPSESGTTAGPSPTGSGDPSPTGSRSSAAAG